MTDEDRARPAARTGESRARSRRRLLRQVGAGSLGLLGVASTAAAQSTGTTENGTAEDGTTGQAITTTGAIVDQEQYQQDLAGFWIHLAASIDPYEASVDEECPGIEWDYQSARVYDGRLIDRRAEPEQTRIRLFLHRSVEVSAGALFIVNEVYQCGSEFLEVELEQMGADIGVGLPETAVDTPAMDAGGGAPEATPTQERGAATEGTGPGIGMASAVAALLGAGWLARRADDGPDGER